MSEYTIKKRTLRDEANETAALRGHMLRWDRVAAKAPFGSTFRQIWRGTCVVCGRWAETNTSVVSIGMSSTSRSDGAMTRHLKGTAIHQGCR
jgi:hypothetical protein